MIICPSFSMLVWDVGLFSLYFFFKSGCLCYSSSSPKSKGLSHFFCRFNSVVHLAGDKMRRFTEVERHLFSHLFLYPNNKINFYHTSYLFLSLLVLSLWPLVFQLWDKLSPQSFLSLPCGQSQEICFINFTSGF